ncbi:MAG TPA: sigma-70 family RNA polymerase sigma factor [Saprospiraceae bacterium]|mgnify:CR=1 FL=1|nr:sigma-70 family RNA polymerase sigma factor [Saprospiraceae bacterium]HMQ81524.1 sigma-70 family RNA polymerase sigma factor [Saprospiraceae bacterium]
MCSFTLNWEERDRFLIDVHQRYHQQLRLYAQGLCRKLNIEATYADDALQELYAKMLNDHELVEAGFRKGGAAYLYTMVKNELLGLQRKKNSRIRLQEKLKVQLPEQMSWQQHPIEHHIEDFLQRAALLLTEQDLAILKLYLEGWKMNEISQTLNLNKSTVGVRIHRMKNDLRSLME